MKLRFYVAMAVLAAIAFSTTSCFRQDVRTVTFKVPAMKSAECSKIIQGALSRIEGIVSAEPDLAQGELDVTYDARKLAIKNIEFLIAGLGFDVDDSQGKPEAKANLPAECR